MELLITPRSICQTEFLSRVCKFKKENRRLVSDVLHETKLGTLSLKSEFAFFHSLSQLFLPTYFVKCRRTLLELNS